MADLDLLLRGMAHRIGAGNQQQVYIEKIPSVVSLELRVG